MDLFCIWFNSLPNSCLINSWRGKRDISDLASFKVRFCDCWLVNLVRNKFFLQRALSSSVFFWLFRVQDSRQRVILLSHCPLSSPKPPRPHAVTGAGIKNHSAVFCPKILKCVSSGNETDILLSNQRKETRTNMLRKIDTVCPLPMSPH